MRFPMLNISDLDWTDEEDLTVFTLFDSILSNVTNDYYQKYIHNKLFCDCSGDVYKVVQKIQRPTYWQKSLKFLPLVKKMELDFEKQNNKMPLEVLRSFVLARLADLKNTQFVHLWQLHVENAKNHSEIIDDEP